MIMKMKSLNKSKKREQIKKTTEKIALISLIALIILSLGIIFSKNASALGISPGTKTLFYEESLQKSQEITIINSEKKDLSLEIEIKGELKDFIELSQKEIKFKKGEQEKKITYTITFPKDLEELKSGTKTTEIIIKQKKEINDGNTVVTPLVYLIHQLKIIIPYPQKYMEAKQDIKTKNNYALFFIRADNLGSEDIEKLKADIYIYDKKNNLIKVINTSQKKLELRKRTELKADWQAEFLGNYKAVSQINYDEKQIKIENRFTLGDFFITPLKIKSANYKENVPIKIKTELRNLAYEKISGLKAKIIIEQDENKKIEFTSNSEEISAGSIKTISLFGFIPKTEYKKYNASLILSYQNKEKKFPIYSEIKENKIEFYLPLEKTQKTKTIPLTLIISSVIILLITLYLIDIRHKKKNKR